MVTSDLPQLSADQFTAWYTPSSEFVDRDGHVWKSPAGILEGMQKVFKSAELQVEHKETKLISGVVLLRPEHGVVEIAKSFLGGRTAEFQDQRDGDVIGDVYFCEHRVTYVPLLPDNSRGEGISVSRMIEFWDGPAEIAGQGTFGRQHWGGKVWWDSNILKSEIQRREEASKS
jgi:hypothetical protein